MANPGYVRSTDGDNADDGSTWALANATAAGAITDASAGDRIYFSHSHSESTNSALTLTFPGTAASPNTLICGNDGAEPPTAVATTAVIATGASAYSINVRGTFYAYGLTFKPGVGATAIADLRLADADQNYQVYDSCVFQLASTSASADIAFGATSAASEARIDLKNCTFTFGNASQGFELNIPSVRIYGGSVTSAITQFLQLGAGTLQLLATGLDLSSCATSLTLMSSGSTGTGRVVFRNCKLPSSWSGSLMAGQPNFPGVRGEMHNCSAGDTNYALWVEDYAGSIKQETTLVKDSGASDGTTPLSWKMTTTSGAEYPTVVLASPEIQIWNETVGSSVTVTVDFLHDSVTALQDDEIWLEVEYLGTAGFPLSLFTDDAAADILATPADQTASSATWTTTGMSNPNEQKLSVSFTPQEKGLIVARVHVAKASYTVYVDPLIVIS